MNSIAVALGVALVSSGTAQPLSGTWGTFGARLTLNDRGGVLQQECASTTFKAVSLDQSGRFQTTGRMEESAGRQRADESLGMQPVSISGKVEGDTLQLEMMRVGREKTVLTLRKDSRAKVIRCM